jgi:hypothetical protein
MFFFVRCGMDLAFTGRCCGFSNYFIVFPFLLLFVFAIWSASPCDCSIADAFPNQKQQTKPAAKPAAGTAPRFEIKKWNAVAMWSWDICADTVSFWVDGCSLAAPRLSLTFAHITTVRHLPQLSQRAVHRVPGQSLAHQRQWSLHCLWQLRPRLSP